MSAARRRKIRQIVGIVVVAAITTVLVLPLVWMVSFSLRNNTDLLAGPSLIPRELTFRNYVDVEDR